METGQDCAGPSGNFDRLWPSWLTPFGCHSCPYGWGREGMGGLQPESFPSLSFPAKGTKLCESQIAWMQSTIKVLRVSQWLGVEFACSVYSATRTDSLCCFQSHLLKHFIQTTLTCFALMPVPRAGLSDCSCSWLAQPELKIRLQPFATFFEKKQGLYACDAHYTTNLSKMFTVLFECSPLLPIKKTNPPGKALLKILLAITLDFRDCKCKRSGNRKPLMWGKNHFREKWIQQTWGTCTLLKKSLYIIT